MTKAPIAGDREYTGVSGDVWRHIRAQVSTAPFSIAAQSDADIEAQPEAQIEAQIEQWALKVPFVIARSHRTHATVVTVSLRAGGVTGCGECQPNPRFGFSAEQVGDELAAIGIKGSTVTGLIDHMQDGRISSPASNALSSALLDWCAKAFSVSVPDLIGRGLIEDARSPVSSVITVSLGDPDTMATQALAFFKEQSKRPIKLKLGAVGDAERMHMVRKTLGPTASLIVDANEGWAGADLDRLMQAAKDCRIAMVEQPLPAGDDSALRAFKGGIPLCADEAFTGAQDIMGLSDRYDMVNIKLDKVGGLVEALALRERLEASGMAYMLGCMLGTSLAMAPAWYLADRATFVDLDGPLLLADDRSPSMVSAAGQLLRPDHALWGCAPV